jgi:beta-N-acetylhexosaminidase
MSANLEVKIGQMLLVGFRGFAVDAASPIVRDIRERHLGGVILFDYDTITKESIRNIQSPEQVARLVTTLRKQEASLPLFISIDQEGGKVNRLKERFGFPPSVSAQHLGTCNQPELTQKYADMTASTLAGLGINLNFAPSVDLNVNPQNPVIGRCERSFSPHPDIVCTHAAEWIACHQAYNVLCALKHFPGHGSSSSDSHLGFVDVTETWSSDELLPYERLIGSGGCDMVMTAHIFNARLDSTFPATLSRKILTGILRKELRYDGVIITDDMQMKAISAHYGFERAIQLAIEAGVDILTFGNNLSYDEDITAQAVAVIKNFVATGVISETRIEQSYQRIARLKHKCLSAK